MSPDDRHAEPDKPISHATIVPGPRPGDPPTVIGPPMWPVDPQPPGGRPPIRPMPLPPVGRPIFDPRPPRYPLSSGNSGGGTGFHVDVDQLRTVSGHATRVGRELAEAVRGHAAALTQAGSHTGWAVSAALGRCADGWRQELTDVAEAVGRVGGKLAGTATDYSTVDGSVGERLNRILPMAGGR